MTATPPDGSSRDAPTELDPAPSSDAAANPDDTPGTRDGAAPGWSTGGPGEPEPAGEVDAQLPRSASLTPTER